MDPLPLLSCTNKTISRMPPPPKRNSSHHVDPPHPLLTKRDRVRNHRNKIYAARTSFHTSNWSTAVLSVSATVCGVVVSKHLHIYPPLEERSSAGTTRSVHPANRHFLSAAYCWCGPTKGLPHLQAQIFHLSAICFGRDMAGVMYFPNYQKTAKAAGTLLVS